MGQKRDDQASKIAELEEAIAGLETALKFLPDEQKASAQANLATLRRKRAELAASSQGSGARAQGEGATAVNERGAAVGGDVGGSVITGDHNRAVQAEQYIEHYHEASSPPGMPADRVAYLHRVLRTAGQLSLAGVDPKVASDDPNARLQLSAVYTALLTYGVERLDELQGWRGGLFHTAARQLSALAQLDRYPYLVLLGDPGSGKSTFAQFAALCLAGACLAHKTINLTLLTAPLPDEAGEDQAEPQPWQHGPLLPLFVTLRDFAARGLPPVGEAATARHLWHYLETELAAAALPEYAPHLRREWQEMGGLLLLDGLDEVPQANQRREQIKQVIEDFVASFPRVRVLVTSRTYAYQQQAWQLPDFAVAVLAPFSRGQIRRYVRRWYGHIAGLRGWHPDEGQGRANLLQQAIFGSERLRDLAERPLLLALMASLHAWRGGSLPEKREELYADAVDLLLDWWESQRQVHDAQGSVAIIQPSLAEWLKVDRDKVRLLLHHLAYQAHAAQPELVGTADIPEGDLVSGLMRLSQNPAVNPARLVEYLTQRAGLLLPRGDGVYAFPHRTFQEYLAACYLTDHDYPDKVAELACQDANRWREVALLAGAKAARGSSSTLWALVEALCFQEPDEAAAPAWGAHLAGQVLAESALLEHVSPRHQVKVERVRQWLVHILPGQALPAAERAAAAVNLAHLGDPRPEVMTTAGMQFCLVPAGPFWLGSNEDNPVEKEAERPLHEHTIPYDYWLGRFPVTNAQFAEFVAAGGYGHEAYWPEAQAADLWREGQVGGYTWIAETEEAKEMWRDRPYDYGRPFNLPNHPVVGLNWYESLAFTRWLTERWQAGGQLPPGWHITLPSEAEWEKAARGGLQVPASANPRPLAAARPPNKERLPKKGRLRKNRQPQRQFPWGQAAATPEQANYRETNIGSTSGCGCFPAGAGPYGAEEMAGNVLEWTRSVWGRYDPEKSQKGNPVFDPLFCYPYVPGDGREDLAHDFWWPRTVRGGVWAVDETWLRCASRDWYGPDLRGYDVGFRVVCVPILPLGSDLSDL